MVMVEIPNKLNSVLWDCKTADDIYERLHHAQRNAPIVGLVGNN